MGLKFGMVVGMLLMVEVKLWKHNKSKKKNKNNKKKACILYYLVYFKSYSPCAILEIIINYVINYSFYNQIDLG